MRLRLADDLTLPAEAATQTFLVVGKRGSGKSTTCVRLAEQLIKADVPIIAIDPVDRWWGLKASRDGKGPGLSVYVFGGEHADLPLESGAGALIADTVVEHRLSAVLSVKHLSGHDRGRFVSDLAGRLFQRNKEPLHVFLEEAHEVAPQQPFKGEEEMVGRVTRLWKLGRSSGIGGSAITQRPASLSKNITTQAEILIVHRMLGPQDVAAVREWIKYHGERDDILGELATLKTGEAFVWAPDFPEGKPIGLKRVQILDRETFDSSATPKVGQRAVEPKALAAVDLEQLRTRMAATIEKAKAEDPRELRRRIGELEAELKTRIKGVLIKSGPVAKRIEVPILKDGQLKRIEALTEFFTRSAARLEDAQRRLSDPAERLYAAAQEVAAAVRAATMPAPTMTYSTNAQIASPPVARFGGRPHSASEGRRITVQAGTHDLGKGERAILAAVAQHGAQGVTREQLTVLTGYRRSTRDTYLQRLGAAGHVEIQGGGQIVASRAGLDVLGPDFAPLPTGAALRDHWLSELPEGERRILALLLEAYPKALEREVLSEQTGYQRSSRDTYLQRLKARQLVVDAGRGAVQASETLF